MKFFQFFLVFALLLIIGLAVLGLIKKETKGADLKNISAGEKVIFTFKDEKEAQKAKEVLEKEGRKVESYPKSRFLSLEKKESDEERLSGINYQRAEKDIIYQILKTPNDTRFSEQTNLTQIKAPAAWEYLSSAPTVIVAVIDTGIDGTHEDLTGQVVGGYDYVNNQVIAAGVDSDDNGHGTNLAGVLGGLGNNAKGVAGVSWQVLLMPVKAFNSQGQAQASAVASAIDYAVNNGATVLNMSFGGDYSEAVADAISRTKNKGVVAVAAAGNDGNNNTLYPAGLADVISVGSVNNNDDRSSFSNYNSALDIMAPGENVLTAKDGGGYVTASGTSLATPHVAAAAALYLTNNPGFSRQNTIDALLNGADKVAGILTLPADLTYQFSVTFRNNNATVWRANSPTPVRVGLDRDHQDSTPFQGEGWLAASRPVGLSTDVGYNGAVTFSFQLKTPPGQIQGTYKVYFRLLAENYTWFQPENGGFWLEIRVPEVKSQWVSQTGNLQKLKRGETGTLSTTFKNTSQMPWLSTGQAPIRLAVDKNWSCCGAALQANNWISPTRISTATQSIIQPEENATFTFNITVPLTMPLGLHEFHARLVQENRSWFEGDEGHVWWKVEVVE
ncbi:S8 family serine peptidase [Candidatus Berkelbacteria bacterium]|nr:S8 family serine peptidase [Candidatus Berkelbacteria bacterium]